MKRRTLLAVAVAIFSAGWLFPLWMGVETYFSFWRVEGWPRLLGEHPANSFPFFSFVSTCIGVAFFWLGLVVCFWSYLGFSILTARARE